MTPEQIIEVATHVYAGEKIRQAIAYYAVGYKRHVQVEFEIGDFAPRVPQNPTTATVYIWVGHAWVAANLPSFVEEAEVRLAEYILRNGHK